MKTCNTACECKHKRFAPIGYECGYEGYCDFQTPRDSRQKDIVKIDFTKE